MGTSSIQRITREADNDSQGDDRQLTWRHPPGFVAVSTSPCGGYRQNLSKSNFDARNSGPTEVDGRREQARFLNAMNPGQAEALPWARGCENRNDHGICQNRSKRRDSYREASRNHSAESAETIIEFSARGVSCDRTQPGRGH